MTIQTRLATVAWCVGLLLAQTAAAQTAETSIPVRITDPVPTASGGLSLMQLAMMERVSDPRLSPDGKRIVYALRSTEWETNKANTSAWLIEADGTPRRLAVSDGGLSSVRWSSDGNALYFLSSRGGSNQVWRADRDGHAAVQVTTLPIDVTSFRILPDGRGLILSAAVFIDCADLDCTRDRLKGQSSSLSTVRGYDRLPLRPWDSWNDGRRSHLFFQALNGSGLADGVARDLLPGLDADVPTRPMGDDSEYTVSPDGRHLVYQAQTQGRTEAFTNNSDLFRMSLADGAPINLTEANSGADSSPAYSPDGRQLAWLAGRRENVGGDQPRIMVARADGGDARPLAAEWDRGAGSLRWSADGRAVFVQAAENGQQKLFRIDARTGGVSQVNDEGTVGGFDERGGRLILTHETFSGPAQIVERLDGTLRPLTRHNAEALASTDLPAGELFTFSGWNDEPVQGWTFKPAGYVEGQTYPVVYLIHGGPKSPWTDGWSYRWNPQIYSGGGYGVVMINFHGSPGFGQAFTDAINDHWGDRPLEDLQKGWQAALSRNAWMDGDRACALGASYGGYMVNMIAGRWNEPWRCLVNHAGVFDVGQLMNAMDIGNFVSEFGGPSWERADLYQRFSPGTYVADWKKPMLVLHGSRDFRVPVEQGLATFSALQRQGVESRFVHVPDENHWVLKPRNWVDWQQEILNWTADHTGASPAP